MVGRPLEDVSLLEALRADKGLTQYVAAAEAGMSHKTLKKYEQDGLANPRLDVLDKLGRYYGVRGWQLRISLHKIRALEATR
jgi:transcriptional regulator with XRE-family HTH domain